MKKVLRALLVTALLIPALTLTPAFAFNDSQGNQNQNGGNGGSTKAPLDGGIALLLAAGVGLGVYKVVKHNKTSKQAH